MQNYYDAFHDTFDDHSDRGAVFLAVRLEGSVYGTGTSLLERVDLSGGGHLHRVLHIAEKGGIFLYLQKARSFLNGHGNRFTLGIIRYRLCGKFYAIKQRMIPWLF